MFNVIMHQSSPAQNYHWPKRWNDRTPTTILQRSSLLGSATLVHPDTWSAEAQLLCHKHKRQRNPARPCRAPTKTPVKIPLLSNGEEDDSMYPMRNLFSFFFRRPYEVAASCPTKMQKSWPKTPPQKTCNARLKNQPISGVTPSPFILTVVSISSSGRCFKEYGVRFVDGFIQKNSLKWMCRY